MANFITPNVVAKQALISLENNLVMGGLIHRDYKSEFHTVGDTVTIRKPSTFDSVRFDGDLTGQYKQVNETSTTVSLDTTFVVPIEVTAHDLTLNVQDFYTQITEPVGQALAQDVDAWLMELYKDIPYQITSAGTVADIINCRKEMNINKTPPTGKRNAVLSDTTSAMFLALDTFHEADKAGTTEALRNARIGKAFGFDIYESQNVPTHAIGSTDVEGAIDEGNVAAGSTMIHIDGLGTTDTYAKGTILTIADCAGQYVLTQATTCSGGEGDFYIYPALEEDTADGKVVTIAPAATTSSENMFFHEKAFTMVTAPLAAPLGGAKGTTMSYGGWTINVTYDYDSATMKNIMQFSILAGKKTLYPEMAVRLYDAS